jgi:hypothetical protein
MGTAMMAGGAGLLGGMLIGDVIGHEMSDSQNDAYADGERSPVFCSQMVHLPSINPLISYLVFPGYNDVNNLIFLLVSMSFFLPGS